MTIWRYIGIHGDNQGDLWRWQWSSMEMDMEAH